MHPTGVATAAWVFASPSKTLFYLAGALLACWAVLLAAVGITHPDFPGSAGRGRLVILTSALLVAAALTLAVATSSHPGESRKAQAPPSGAGGPSSTLRFTTDPTGAPAYSAKHAAAKPGRIAIQLVNRSPVPHNVTIATGTRTVVATRTIQGASTTVDADLPPGTYVFFCSVDAHREAGMQGTLTVR